jgi:hypothetical protein
MELHNRGATTEEVANEVGGQMLQNAPASIEEM